VTFIIALMIGLAAGSLSEYWVHRLEHWSVLRAQDHLAHHMNLIRRGWWREYWAYLRVGGAPIALVGCISWYLWGWPAAVGWTLGIAGHLAFFALVHEMYHTDPNLVFWVSRPVHYFHHKHNQWRYNFGFTTTLWDKLFGTFKDDPTWVPAPVPFKKIFSVKFW